MYKDRDLSILKIVERIFLRYKNIYETFDPNWLQKYSNPGQNSMHEYYIKIPQCTREKKKDYN